MFMGPLESTKPWNTNGVEGMYRFLSRIWRLFVQDDGTLNAKIVSGDGSDSFQRTWHKSIKKITEDFEALRFNTAISQLMIFVNDAYKAEQLPKEAMNDFVQMLSPLAPHLAEELWERLGHKDSLSYASWPIYNEALTVEDEVEIVVQINGKIVDRVSITRDTDENEMQEIAMGSDKVKEAMANKTVRKVIAVKGKLVNIVVG
jgi:leucyl-tRNA synthetase